MIRLINKGRMAARCQSSMLSQPMRAFSIGPRLLDSLQKMPNDFYPRMTLHETALVGFAQLIVPGSGCIVFGLLSNQVANDEKLIWCFRGGMHVFIPTLGWIASYLDAFFLLARLANRDYN